MMVQLEEIKARVEVATKGPWRVGWENGYKGDIFSTETGERVLVPDDPYCSVEGKQEDMEFIANAREDVPFLIAEVERLRAENERLRRDGCYPMPNMASFTVSNGNSSCGTEPAR